MSCILPRIPLAILVAIAFAGAGFSEAPDTFDDADVAGTAGPEPRTPDYAKDIEPLIRANCTACHRQQGVAPFPLTSPDDVRRRARQIALVTESGFMPPWKPDPGWGAFEGERRLTRGEIDTIRAWLDAGTPQGDLDAIPPQPAPADAWRLGKPDLVVTLETPYELRAGGRDVFRSFVLPLDGAVGRVVRGIEIRPGNPRVVHHATVYADSTGGARQLDELDIAPGYDGMEVGVFPGGHFFGWTPGHTPRLLDDGMGWTVPAGTDLVLEAHLLPSGKPESVRPRLGLYLSDDPPERFPATVRLGATAIDIPAGAREWRIEDSFVLPIDVTAYAIYPHAHFLGRSIEARALLPGGEEKRLIRISDWDFNWQDEYRFEPPVRLPAGTRLEARWVFDNSPGNVRNPNDPPRRVRWGPGSTDEMAEVWLRVLPGQDEDLVLLTNSIRRKDYDLRVSGFEARLEADPQDFDASSRLGQLMLLARRMDRAVQLLERARQLEPAAWHVRYNLGVALTHLGRLDDAIREYREALKLRPDRPGIYSNLGVALLLARRDAEAEEVLREAVLRWPDFVEARTNHGVVLARLGRLDEALLAYEAVLASRPDYPEAHANLGSALLRLGKTDDSERHLRRALELRPGDPDPLKNLALIAISRGDEARAAGLLQRAISSAPRDPDARLLLVERLVRLGRREDAVREMEAVIRIAPSHPGLERARELIEQTGQN